MEDNFRIIPLDKLRLIEISSQENYLNFLDRL